MLLSYHFLCLIDQKSHFLSGYLNLRYRDIGVAPDLRSLLAARYNDIDSLVGNTFPCLINSRLRLYQLKLLYMILLFTDDNFRLTIHLLIWHKYRDS